MAPCVQVAAYATVAVTSLFGQWFSSAPRCFCECVGTASADERILDILRDQLRRCGPEQLVGSHSLSDWVFCLAGLLVIFGAGFAAGWLGRGRASETPQTEVWPQKDAISDAKCPPTCLATTPSSAKKA